MQAQLYFQASTLHFSVLLTLVVCVHVNAVTYGTEAMETAASVRQAAAGEEGGVGGGESTGTITENIQRPI